MKNKFVQGLIKRHADGFGFLIPEDKTHPDLYIPHHGMTGVMSGDRVLAEAQKENGSDRYRGEIIRVVSRGMKKVVGPFSKLNESYGIIRDDGNGWGQDLRIKTEDSLNAKSGDLVAAEILTYPEPGEKFTGKVIEVIGNAEDPMNDIRRVVHGNNIPEEFPPDVLEEAKRIPNVPDEKDFKNRKDLRGKDLITIDGATAKDFDDAILVERVGQGFRLFVAIADVSHYVRPGSAIDREAFQRGTSVYFPNFVIPMLPEVLSNGLCSLNPHVPRLCLVAEMEFDFSGVMTSSSFYEGVMESKARVTYGKAQEVVDGAPVPEFDHVREPILRAADLAKILMAKRFREGSVDLEIPETILQIDGTGKPLDVIRSERLFAHRLIEELMLAANVAVALFLGERKVPAIYRVHEPPNALAISLLERYMESFGGHTSLSGNTNLQKKLTKALEEFHGKPEAQILHILTLRSMSQAKYQQENLGHFGLGFDHYTHFTSPIRRYPDLIVHRLLKNQAIPGSSYRLMPSEELDTAGTWLSACEQRSVKAERQLMAIKKARFMQPRIGQEFEGLVSSIARFGAFVLLREYEVDGLVRVEDLGDGRWEFNEEKLKLVAKSSGMTIGVGDVLKVVVAATDISTGQITFLPADKWGQGQRTSSAGPSQRDIARKGSRGVDKKRSGGREDRDRGKPKKSKNKRNQEKKFARGPSSEPLQKNSQERGTPPNNSGGVRKARVSQSGGKSSPGPVSGRKTKRKR